MAGKNRCYLCGQKLRRGVCTCCGLDNARMTRRNYRLNETTPHYIKQRQIAAQKAEQMTYANAYKEKQQNLENRGKSASQRLAQKRTVSHRPIQERSVSQRTIQTRTADQRSWQTRTVSSKPVSARETGDRNKKTTNKMSVGKIIGIIYAVIMFIPALGSCISEISDEFTYGIPEFGSVSYPEEVLPDSYLNEDTYSYVTRELSDTGEHYEKELAPGYYLVGVHIPEGTYTIEASQGLYGSMYLEDHENAIYISESLGEDSYDSVMGLEDVRLYAGAHLDIAGDIRLNFISENAQVDALTGMENPLGADAIGTFSTDESFGTDVIGTFSADEYTKLTVGEDIPAGIYNLSIVEGWTNVSLTYHQDENNSYEYYYWLDSENYENCFRNLVLVEGMTVGIEAGTVQFIPSSWIPTDDYEAYFKEYFYIY